MMTHSQLLERSSLQGPRYYIPGSFLWRMRRNPLGYLASLQHEYGDFVRLQVGPLAVHLISDPELIRELLVTQEKSFRKGRGLQVARRVVGNGLLTSEGDFHRSQRKLMQPVFQRQRVAGFGETMVAAARETSGSWCDGAVCNVLAEMNALTLVIVGRTLFDCELGHECEAVARALEEGRKTFAWAMFPLFERLERLIPALKRRSRKTREQIDATLFPIIEEHRRRPRADLLSLLIEAEMDDEQVRDEAVTLFLAGHETTANALAWTLHLLAENPAVLASLHTELDRGLGGTTPQAADLPRLPYTERVLLESMRLFPPAWIVGRSALEDVELGGHRVPAGSVVLASQYLVHRDERWFPDPGRFEPERWERTPRGSASLPRYAYFPFGGGSRVCVGEHFAMMEAVLILATLMQAWSVEAIAGQTIAPNPSITLRPHPGPKVRLRVRPGSG